MADQKGRAKECGARETAPCTTSPLRSSQAAQATGRHVCTKQLLWEVHAPCKEHALFAIILAGLLACRVLAAGG